MIFVIDGLINFWKLSSSLWKNWKRNKEIIYNGILINNSDFVPMYLYLWDHNDNYVFGLAE